MGRVMIFGGLAMVMSLAVMTGLAWLGDGPLPPPAQPGGPAVAAPRGLLRLATFIPPGKSRPTPGLAVSLKGVDRLFPLADIWPRNSGPAPADMTAFIADWPRNLALARAAAARLGRGSDKARLQSLDPASVSFLPPVPRPVKLVDCSIFAAHSRNIARAFYRELTPGWVYRLAICPLNLLMGDGLFTPDPGPGDGFLHFVGNNLNIHGSGSKVMLPRGAGEIDIEPELALLVVKGGRDLTGDRARAAIGGWMLFIDFSRRDVQAGELSTGFGFVKSKAINALGPYLVVGLDPRRVRVEVKVDGRPTAVLGLGDARFSPAEVVARVSAGGEGVAPGQVIGLGTLTGGSLFETDRPMLRPGQRVEISGSHGLGSLGNRLIAWRPPEN